MQELISVLALLYGIVHVENPIVNDSKTFPSETHDNLQLAALILCSRSWFAPPAVPLFFCFGYLISNGGGLFTLQTELRTRPRPHSQLFFQKCSSLLTPCQLQLWNGITVSLQKEMMTLSMKDSTQVEDNFFTTCEMAECCDPPSTVQVRAVNFYVYD